MKIQVKCPCGKILFFTPGQIRPGHGKYCSRKCTFKYKNNLKFLEHAKKRGMENHNWKGDTAGYKALHLRITQERGKAKQCLFGKGHKFVEWANVSGEYQNVFDYIPLCRKCHQKFDDVHTKGWNTRKGGDVTA
jgi:hypothetical protein